MSIRLAQVGQTARSLFVLCPIFYCSTIIFSLNVSIIKILASKPSRPTLRHFRLSGGMQATARYSQLELYDLVNEDKRKKTFPCKPSNRKLW